MGDVFEQISEMPKFRHF